MKCSFVIDKEKVTLIPEQEFDQVAPPELKTAQTPHEKMIQRYKFELQERKR